MAAAAHYRRNYRRAHGGVSFAVSFAVNTIARRITGGGYIRHYQFGGGGALPAAHSFAILSTALLPAQLSPCARRRFFCGFFCRQYNRTALPAAVISGIINLAAAAHYRRRILSPPPIAVIYRRHLKHCAITGAIITAHGGVSFAVSFAVNINRTALPAAVISGIINLAAAAHYRRRILSPS